MRPINSNTIDDIMFALLEGEIQGREREQLLEAIEADPEYAELWKIWQNTVIQMPEDSPTMDTGKLKKKRRAFVPMYIRYAAAAAIVITAGTGLFMYTETSKDSTLPVASAIEYPSAHGSGKLHIPAGPSDSVFILKKHDTLKQSREKFRYMAGQSNLHHSNTGHLKPQQSNSTDEGKAIETMATVQDFPMPEIPEVEYVIPTIVENQMETVPVLAENSHIIVETESGMNTIQHNQKSDNTSLLERLFGIRKIRIENNGNSFSDKKLIIENKKYQIIAGF